MVTADTCAACAAFALCPEHSRERAEAILNQRRAARAARPWRSQDDTHDRERDRAHGLESDYRDW